MYGDSKPYTIFNLLIFVWFECQDFGQGYIIGGCPDWFTTVYSKGFPMLKLHLGSGSRLLSGWLNVDEWEGYPYLTSDEYLRHDLRHPIPLPDGCASYVYSEHFIEHLDRESGDRMFREMYRLLGVGGVMRISTPNLAEIVDAYVCGDLKRFRESWHPESLAKLVNEALTSWGHRFVYDLGELRGGLELAGFREVVVCDWGVSAHEGLCGLEQRPMQNDLILEAIR